MLYHRSDWIEIQDCKIITGDHVAAQHCLDALDVTLMITQRQL